MEACIDTLTMTLGNYRVDRSNDLHITLKCFKILLARIRCIGNSAFYFQSILLCLLDKWYKILAIRDFPRGNRCRHNNTLGILRM